METPLLKLTRKDFLTGVTGHAHSEQGGLFYKMSGMSVVNGMGQSVEAEVGCLEPTSTGQFDDAAYVDDPFVGVRDAPGATIGTSYIYILGSDGNFYKKDAYDGTPTNLRSGGNVIPSLANGLEIFQAVGGTRYLYYWQTTQIGRWDLSSSYPTGWVDNQYTGLTSTVRHPTHKFVGRVYYGNDSKLGKLEDDGAAGITHSLNDLDLPAAQQITALEDDGSYLVIASTSNKAGTFLALGENKVYFYDTNSPSWTIEHNSEDLIVDMKRVGNIVYGIGARGIYRISLQGGVEKVWTFGTNIGSFGTLIYGPGIMSSFNGALIYGRDDGTVCYFGKPAPDLPFGFHRPILITAGITSTVTFVDGEFSSGYVLVGDTSNTVEFFSLPPNFTYQTGGSAQTRYLDLGGKRNIKRIDLIFAVPLASGDEVNLDVRSDQTTAAQDWGTASYAADGGVLRKSIFNSFTTELLSIVFNAVGGSPKIAGIEVYEDVMTP